VRKPIDQDSEKAGQQQKSPMRRNLPAKKGRRGNAGNAQRSFGKAHPVVENTEHDHLKTKRGDGEIVVVYPQRRIGDDNAQNNGKKNADPDIDPEPGFEIEPHKRRSIGADAVECCVSHGQQTGVAGNKIERDRNDDIDVDEDEDVQEIVHKLNLRFLERFAKEALRTEKQENEHNSKGDGILPLGG